MNGAPSGPNEQAKPKTVDEALAKLRANPRVIAGFAKLQIERERYGVNPSTIKTPHKVLRSRPTKKHFSEVDQPELIEVNGEWVRKE